MILAFLAVSITFFTLIYYNFDLLSSSILAFLAGAITLAIIEIYFVCRK